MSGTNRISRLNRITLADSEVYSVLAEHQRNENWDGRELATVLQDWAERFNVEFKLDVPELALRLDRLPVSTFAQFRRHFNGFGLKGEIAFNTLYMTPDCPPSRVLGALLIGQLHAWQQAHGTPAKRNHHNVEFREKARSLGLVVDRRGVTGYVDGGPFLRMLQQHGIDRSDRGASPRVERIRGKSKLKKWTCGCTNIRVAVSDFHALCLTCRQVFRLADA